MAYNEGWEDLNKERFFAQSYYYDDSETGVECLDRNLMDTWVPVTDLAPLVFSRSDEHQYDHDENSTTCACGEDPEDVIILIAKRLEPAIVHKTHVYATR
ncbi:hypothetical protein HDU89_004988 [Geranomyces variabilis]|nr:hypothetical protein HDU89_004988 [Geranomyces variabilis]